MSLMPIPFLFIRKHTSLSWCEALWGYERQMVGWSDIVELAKDQLHLDSDAREVELSCLVKSDAFRVGELLRELTASEPKELESMSAKKWLFLILAWIFENKDQIDDPLGEVETIYADFNYPSEIESFVRYMPVTDDYDPSQHSKKDNENRLFENWKKYLDVTQHKVR